MNERSLHEANIVFVGGSGGIGLAAATAVARRGAAVLIVGRDQGRGEQAARMLRDAGAREATWLPADVSSVAGMTRAVKGIRAWHPVLHGLVHTAVMVRMRRATTPDGFELAFGLQYLARYALNRSLVGQLAASGDGRIVHVGGKAPAGTLPDIEDLQFERRTWALLPALMSSQVLGYLHVQEAARRWHGQPVTASIACVGPTRTNNVREQPWWVRALYAVIATTPERSARNVVGLLTAVDVSNAHGAIFFDPKRFESTLLAYDAGLAKRTWEISEELIQKRGLSLTNSHPV
jgi:NAD(P)-dependent dehydrogenase (short-subunit alcohol dehydrogenase family)